MRVSKSLNEHAVRPRKDKRGFDLISDALPFGGLWLEKVVYVTTARGTI